MRQTTYWMRRAMLALTSEQSITALRVIAFSALTAWFAGMGVYGILAEGHPVIVTMFFTAAVIFLFMAVQGGGADNKWT